MTKGDLVATIADAAGCSKASAEAAYDSLIDKITIRSPPQARPRYAGWAFSNANGMRPVRDATRAPVRRSRLPPAIR